MAARGILKSAGELVRPAVERMVAAIEPPESDAPLVALVRRQARVIDAMPDAAAISMLPNHTGQLIKSLAELEKRAQARRVPAAAPANPVRQMRREWAAKGRAG